MVDYRVQALPESPRKSSFFLFCVIRISFCVSGKSFRPPTCLAPPIHHPQIRASATGAPSGSMWLHQAPRRPRRFVPPIARSGHRGGRLGFFILSCRPKPCVDLFFTGHAQPGRSSCFLREPRGPHGTFPASRRRSGSRKEQNPPTYQEG